MDQGFPLVQKGGSATKVAESRLLACLLAMASGCSTSSIGIIRRFIVACRETPGHHV
jgi:hypothetical protein